MSTLAVAVAVGLGVLSALAVGYAVYLDAAARGSDRALAVGVVAALFALPVVPVYVLVRARVGPRDPPLPTRTERRVRSLALGGLLAFAVAAVAAPPDPRSQVVAAGVAYLPALAVAYLLVGR